MFNPILLSLKRMGIATWNRWGWPAALAFLVAVAAGLGGTWGIASGQTIPVITPYFEMNVGVGGGQGNSSDGQVHVDVPAGSMDGDRTIRMTKLAAADLFGMPSGLSRGAIAIGLLVVDTAKDQLQTQFTPPFHFTYRPTAEEVAAVNGDLSLIHFAYWNGNSWVAVPGTVNPDGSITFIISHTTVFSVVLVGREARVGQQFDVPGGRFFTATNGFGGATGSGFAVIDDDAATFFKEYQRFGGKDRVGLPIGNRFMYKGFITQPFQRLALQWRPELQRAVPVNVFDELNQLGVDSYLDTYHQVPPAADTSPDTGLTFEQVVSRHVAFLDPYPALKEAYLSDPNWLETYGLPLAVKDYGPFVTVRMQRATMQLWKVDMPWAAAGTVVLGNGADVAKLVGMWPVDGVTPRKP